MSTSLPADRVDPSGAEFFEAKYQGAVDHDPWSFSTSAYELDRYRRVLAALPRERYHSAFEPGCSVGALSRPLAERCDHLLAMDFAPTAIEVALGVQRDSADLPSASADIDFRVGALPDDLRPGDGTFDLIVFAEIGYYFSLSDLDHVTHRLVAHLRRDGDLVAAHWTGHSPDHRLSGVATHDRLTATLETLGCIRLGERRSYGSAGGTDGSIPGDSGDGFIIDCWRRT